NAARGIAEAEDWPQRALRLAWRGIALDAMLAEHFPEAIRLTIHPSGSPGGKFPIRLSPAQAEAALPWHRVYLLNLAGRGELVSKRQALDA
ncbi:L-tyrosine/L-tryptophan isonitrile synthase family protein, partial [Chromobacterium haemolyticum]